MYSIMYVTHAFLHSKSPHCPFWQRAQGAPPICALLQDYDIATYLCFFILSFLLVYFLVCQPYTDFSSQFLLQFLPWGQVCSKSTLSTYVGVNKIPQFCQQFTKPTLATTYQLNEHVAMFGNFDIDDSFVRQFWLLAIDQTRCHVSQLSH